MKAFLTIFTIIIFLGLITGCNKSTEPEPSVNSSLVINESFYPNSGYNNLCVMKDGGIAIVCRTYQSQLYVAKISAGFSLQWSGKFDSAINNAGGICSTSDGGLIVVSNLYNTNSANVRIRKLNSIGDVVWVKTYAFDIWNTQSFTIRQTTDYGFIILVSKKYSGIQFPNRPTLFRINADGDSLWSKALMDMPGNTVASDFLIMPDGGFLISGHRTLLRTDAQCDKIWIKSGNIDYVNLIALENNLYAASCDSMFDQSPGHTDQQDIMLLKFDENGKILMQGVYDHGFEDHSYSLTTVSDGGFYIVEQDFWDFYSKQPFLIRTDSHGNESFSVKLPGIYPCGLVKIPSWYVYYGFYQANEANGYSLIVYGFN